MQNKKSNFTLIGMAGVGKSYTGKILAGNLNFEYIDVDQIITEEANKIGVNKDLISDKEFINLEEKAVLSLKDNNNSVIDVGGSVVYSEKSMNLLKSISTIIYLQDTAENIKQRFDARGEPHLIGLEGKTFEELLIERSKFYEKYADLTIDVSKNRDIKDIIKIITKDIF